jgi:hypothetical protein
MVHTVEVRRIGADLAETMAEMRAWIDQHETEILDFEHSTTSPGTTFRVSFRDADAARAFARVFTGTMAGQDPHGAALWTTSTRHQSNHGSGTAGLKTRGTGRDLKSGAAS